MGTRFRLFPQPGFLEHFATPETVEIAAAPGTIGPGPSDERMYTVIPVDKEAPYGIEAGPHWRSRVASPPWMGDILIPPEPDADGHFDHLEVGTPQFEAAHLYGSARFVLDIWEKYTGRPVEWHFSGDQDRLELSIFPPLENAYAGYGFVEVGGNRDHGDYRPYSLNFDVVAHEIGHILLYSELGVPDPDLPDGEYWGVQESAGDLVALISSLHFDSVVNELLDTTSGNLYTFNILNQMGEISSESYIRNAANDVKLSAFADGWTSPHKLSQPLTGAIFDIFVDIFHETLVDEGLITPEMEDLSDQLLATPEYADVMQALFNEAYGRNPYGFKDALLATRDVVGTYLAEAWARLEADNLTFADVADMLLAVDAEISGGRYRRIIRGNFDIREIGHIQVGPRLPAFDQAGHGHLHGHSHAAGD